MQDENACYEKFGLVIVILSWFIYEQSHSLYRLYSLYSLYSRIFAIGVIWSKNPFFDSIFFFLAIDRPLLVASYVL